MSLSVGQRYLSGNQQFPDSNLGTLGGYFRINDTAARDRRRRTALRFPTQSVD